MSIKVLVVDDSGLARRMTRQYVEELGHSVEEATDGAQALERYVLNKHDLVVLDMVMHGMYGLEALAKLRELNPKLPVIVVTADIQKSTREQVKAAGAAAIINKPLNREELAGVMAVVLSGGDRMELTNVQKDTLTELINIGYARAAGALSDLTGHRITLAVPEVDIHEIEKITPLLHEVVDGEITSVNQFFGGTISGNAILLLDKAAALLLNRLLTDRPQANEFDASAREVIIEVGNIVLNACLGVFGNLLQVQISFSVPNLQVDDIEHIMKSVRIQDQTFKYALMIHTRFHLRASDVSGYLVIILGVTSLDRVLQELRKWEERQLG